jgi:hypothetical protein
MARPPSWAARRSSQADELAVAIHAIDDFARSIQNADAKASALGAVLGLVIGSLVQNTTLLRACQSHTGLGIAFVLFLVSLVVAGVFLGMTQVPRLTTADGTSRIAFPAVARTDEFPTGTRGMSLHDEVWLQARILATIALAKFRYLRIALIATGLCLVAFLYCWLATMACASPAAPSLGLL